MGTVTVMPHVFGVLSMPIFERLGKYDVRYRTEGDYVFEIQQFGIVQLPIK
jgi:hypothetical protein